MKIKVKGFSDEDVKALGRLIPSKYTELKGQAAERAEQIIPYLKAIGEFYKEFEKYILNNNKFKSLITQEKPFAAKNKVEDLSQDDQSFIDKNLNAIIPNANLNGKPITLKNISNMDEFKSFLNSINIHPTDQNMINKYLDVVKKSIETGFNSSVGY
jgi:hypothetical protein